MAANDTTSEIVRSKFSDETVVVVAETRGSPGEVQISAERLDCPSAAPLQGPLPASINGTLEGAYNLHPDVCAGVDRVDQSHTFEAPSAGLYTFAAEGPFDGEQVNLVLRRGAGCGGPVVGCRNDLEFYINPASIHMEAGETVTAIVEGLESDTTVYELRVDNSPGTCPDITLDVANNQLGYSAGFSMGQPGLTTCGGPTSGRGSVIAFEADVGGMWTVDVTGTSGFRLSVYEGAPCRGSELACEGSMPSGTVEAAMWSGELVAGRDYYAIVEAADIQLNGFGDFTLTLQKP